MTEFGKTIKKRLIDMDKSQAWLIEEIKARTGLYCDTSYLWKLMNGRANQPQIMAVIRDALDLPEDQE